MTDCPCLPCQIARSFESEDGHPLGVIRELVKDAIDHAEGCGRLRFSQEPVSEPRERLILIRGLLEKAARRIDFLVYQDRAAKEEQ